MKKVVILLLLAGFAPATQATLKKKSGDTAAIKRVITKHLDDVKGCYNSVMGSTATASGKVVVDWIVDDRGHAIDVTVNEKKSTLLGHELANCMTSLVRGWQFERPATGHAITVTYPFMFGPE